MCVVPAALSDVLGSRAAWMCEAAVDATAAGSGCMALRSGSFLLLHKAAARLCRRVADEHVAHVRRKVENAHLTCLTSHCKCMRGMIW